MKTSFLLTVVLSLMLLSPIASFADWQQLKGPLGGDVVSFGTKGTTTFASVRYNGIFRTTDNGTTWTPANKGLTSTMVGPFLVVGDNIFVGTSTGVFVSADNGDNWSASSTGITGTYTSINALAIKGTTMFASTYSNLYISTDNGKNWTVSKTGLPAKEVKSIAVCGDYVFAGMGSNGGVYRSADNGATWTTANAGTGTGTAFPSTYVPAFAVSGNNIFAGTSGHFIYLSTDFGVTWKRIDTGLTGYVGANVVSSIAVIGNKIFINKDDLGVFVSSDNGANWTSKNIGLNHRTTVNALIANGNNLFVGTKGHGIYLSTDEAEKFTAVNNGIACLPINTLFAFDNTVLAGTTGQGIFKTTNSGAAWDVVNSGLTDRIEMKGLSEVKINTIIRSNNAYFVGTNRNGVRRSTDGVNWTACSGKVEGESIGTLYASTKYMYAGSNSQDGIWRADLDGAGWTELNTGLKDYIYFYSFLAIGDKILASTSDGLYTMKEGETTWTSADYWFRPNAFMDNGTALYAAFNDGVKISTDKGVNWKSAGKTMPSTFTYALAYSGKYVFAGTDKGVFATKDGGLIWTNISAGLPNLSVKSLTVQNTSNGPILYAGTEGGSIYTIKDFDNLRVDVEKTLASNASSISNYPNPFKASTAINYQVSNACQVTITVYDMMGKEVATLVNQSMAPGSYSVDFDGSKLPSGVYFAKINAGNTNNVIKMNLTK